MNQLTADGKLFNFVCLNDEDRAKLKEPLKGNALLVVIKDSSFLGPFLQTFPIGDIKMLERKGRDLILHTQVNGITQKHGIWDFRYINS